MDLFQLQLRSFAPNSNDIRKYAESHPLGWLFLVLDFENRLDSFGFECNNSRVRVEELL